MLHLGGIKKEVSNNFTPDISNQTSQHRSLQSPATIDTRAPASCAAPAKLARLCAPHIPSQLRRHPKAVVRILIISFGLYGSKFTRCEAFFISQRGCDAASRTLRKKCASSIEFTLYRSPQGVRQPHSTTKILSIRVCSIAGRRIAPAPSRILYLNFDFAVGYGLPI